MEYPKIQTLWFRHPGGKRYLIENEWAKPEFQTLADLQWLWTEKVDGTNIRVIYNHEKKSIHFAGRTDRAQLLPQLERRLKEIFPVEKFKQFDTSLILFGEGYGEKIQKGGKYISGQDFVLFDVFFNRFVTFYEVTIIASKLGIKHVPIIGSGSLYNAVGFVRRKFESSWGDFDAEGIVCRLPVELQNGKGERVMTKIKLRDFR